MFDFFPIVADKDMSIANIYGMIAPDISTNTTVRNVFILDERQIVRAILVYPLSTGRYIPEIIKLLTALQTVDRERVATPADWLPGDPVVVPALQTYEELLRRVSGEEGYCCIDWYLCCKKYRASYYTILGSISANEIPLGFQYLCLKSNTT